MKTTADSSLLTFRKPGGGDISIWSSEIRDLSLAPARGTLLHLIGSNESVPVDDAFRKVFTRLQAIGWNFPPRAAS